MTHATTTCPECLGTGMAKCPACDGTGVSSDVQWIVDELAVIQSRLEKIEAALGRLVAGA